jgi:NAD/NADP transhydrogenase alpha subunit
MLLRTAAAPDVFGTCDKLTSGEVCDVLSVRRLCVYAQDDEYAAAGATIVAHAASFKSDIVLKIRPPTIEEADMLKERAK